MDAIFSFVKPEAWYERPIPERHRLIFYLGHLETFDWNQICRWTLGHPSFHPQFDQLFEAGIDPKEGELPQDTPSDWPSIEEVQGYNRRVRQEVDRVHWNTSRLTFFMWPSSIGGCMLKRQGISFTI